MCESNTVLVHERLSSDPESRVWSGRRANVVGVGHPGLTPIQIDHKG